MYLFLSNIALVMLFILFLPVICIVGLVRLARSWGDLPDGK